MGGGPPRHSGQRCCSRNSQPKHSEPAGAQDTGVLRKAAKSLHPHSWPGGSTRSPLPLLRGLMGWVLRPTESLAVWGGGSEAVDSLSKGTVVLQCHLSASYLQSLKSWYPLGQMGPHLVLEEAMVHFQVPWVWFLLLG